MRRPSGFTLVELMVVVAMTAVLLGIALVTWRKSGTQRDVDRWAAQIRDAVMTASRRAIAAGANNTSNVYMVDLRATSVQWCQVDPATVSGPPWVTTQTTCPASSSTIEVSPRLNAPRDATTSNYATTVDASAPGSSSYTAATKTAIGSGTVLYLGRIGTASTSFATARSSGLPTSGVGFTAYVQPAGPDDTTKHRRIVVYGPSSRARVIDNF